MIKPLNIMFITHSSQYYGASKSLLLLIKSINNSFNVSVFLNSNGPFIQKLNENQISYYYYTAFQNRILSNILKFRVFLTEIYNRFIYLKTLVKLCKEKKIDIIHINSYYSPYSSLAKLFCNVKLVWHIRETPIFKVRDSLNIFLIKIFADRIIYVSNGTKIHFSHFLQKKSVVIYNGRLNINNIDVKYKNDKIFDQLMHRKIKLSKKGNKPVLIGLIGEISKRKGSDLALDTIKRLIDMKINVLFIFFGDELPSYSNEFHRLLNLYEGILDNTIFFGYIENVENYIPILDIIFHPARRDPFPGVLLESMNYSKPIVASDVDGIPEMVIHNRTGYCFNINNCKLASNYIIDLIHDRKKRLRFGVNGKNHFVNNFNIDKHVYSIIRIYKEFRKA